MLREWIYPKEWNVCKRLLSKLLSNRASSRQASDRTATLHPDAFCSSSGATGNSASRVSDFLRASPLIEERISTHLV